MQMDRRALIVAAVALSLLALLGLEIGPRPEAPATPPASKVQAAATGAGGLDRAQGRIETPSATFGADRRVPRASEAAPASSASASTKSEPFLDPSEIFGGSGDADYRSIGAPIAVDDPAPPEGVPVEYGEPLDADDPDPWALESPDDRLQELGEPMDADAPWHPEADRRPPVAVGQPLDADADRDL